LQHDEIILVGRLWLHPLLAAVANAGRRNCAVLYFLLILIIFHDVNIVFALQRPSPLCWKEREDIVDAINFDVLLANIGLFF